MKRKSEDPQDTAAAPALNYGSVHRVFTETLDEHCIKACALLSQDDGHLKIIYYADLDPTMAAVCVKLWALARMADAWQVLEEEKLLGGAACRKPAESAPQPP